MSNLEHVFELALLAIEKGLDHDEWQTMMNKSNCAKNAKEVGFMFRDNYGSPNLELFAKLNDGRRIWLNDIWELAQYTHPWMKMAEDSVEEGPKIHYRICKLRDNGKKKWIVEGPNIFTK